MLQSTYPSLMEAIVGEGSSYVDESGMIDYQVIEDIIYSYRHKTNVILINRRHLEVTRPCVNVELVVMFFFAIRLSYVVSLIYRHFVYRLQYFKIYIFYFLQFFFLHLFSPGYPSII